MILRLSNTGTISNLCTVCQAKWLLIQWSSETILRIFISRASRTLRGATQVVAFLSVRDKKNVGKDRKRNAF